MKYLYDFLIVIAANLVHSFATRTWDSWRETKDRPRKLRENCTIKIRHSLNELDFNAVCEGGPECPFKTEALETLLNSEEISLLDKDLVNSMKQLIEEAGIAKAPYHQSLDLRKKVKTKSKLLKHHLVKQIEELNTYSSSKLKIQQNLRK